MPATCILECSIQCSTVNYAHERLFGDNTECSISTHPPHHWASSSSCRRTVSSWSGGEGAPSGHTSPGGPQPAPPAHGWKEGPGSLHRLALTQLGRLIDTYIIHTCTIASCMYICTRLQSASVAQELAVLT